MGHVVLWGDPPQRELAGESDGYFYKDGSYKLFHSYNIELPRPLHPERLTGLGDHWLSRGYKVDTFMTYPTGDGGKVGGISAQGDGIGFYVDTVSADGPHRRSPVQRRGADDP